MIEEITRFLSSPAITTPAFSVSNAATIVATTALGVGAVGAASAAAKAISNQRIIVETWDNQTAPSDFDRARASFSNARTGLKEWYQRHKKEINKIGLVSLVGALLGYQLLNPPKEKEQIYASGADPFITVYGDTGARYRILP